MSNRFTIALLVLIGFLVLPWARAHAAERPNVILVLTDDQGYGDLSAHGNPVLKTPNLDRLHAESIRLTDFQQFPAWRCFLGMVRACRPVRRVEH